MLTEEPRHPLPPSWAGFRFRPFCLRRLASHFVLACRAFEPSACKIETRQAICLCLSFVCQPVAFFSFADFVGSRHGYSLHPHSANSIGPSVADGNAASSQC